MAKLDLTGTIYEGLPDLSCDLPWCNRSATRWDYLKHLGFMVPMCSFHASPTATKIPTVED